MKGIIDYHHHVAPPEYIAEMKKHGITERSGFSIRKFDPVKNLKFMNKAGIEKAMLSVSAPGVYVKNPEITSGIARICNEYTTEQAETFPGRYGGFASLPFPAMKESLKELEYALDTLKMDGVVLLTHAEQTYLGEPGQDELFQELNRRSAVVFIHPDDLVIHKGPYLPQTPWMERYMDTNRAAYNLFLNGYLEKYPRIRFILSHGGAGIPVMAGRIVREYFNRKGKPFSREEAEGKLEEIKSFFFDTGQRGKEILTGLKEFCGTSQIVFGSDTPYVPGVENLVNIKEIREIEEFSGEEKENLLSGKNLEDDETIRSAV